MQIRTAWFALGTIIVVLSIGCSRERPSVADTGAPVRKVLRYGNGAEPQDLDPQIVTGTPEHRLVQTFFEGLVSEDPQLNVIPGVARTWDISDDGLVYTFHLRPDARWSDGTPLTAQDFVDSYQRMLTPAFGAEYAYMLWHVVGAEDYNKGRLTDFSRTGFKALDPHTLQLTLRQRTPFLLHALNHEAWMPVPVATIRKFGGFDRRSTPWTRPENFVGNGPYVLKVWRPNQIIVAERSPTYWDRSHVKIDEIDFYPVELAETEERMFRTGQLDITYEVPLSKIPLYRREHPDQLRIDPYNGVYFYRFNVNRKPFDDVRVRRALALAINREQIVRDVTRGGELPAYHLVPPNILGYNSRYSIHEDVAEARRLLAEAGYPGGRGFPRVDLLYNTLERHRIIAEAIQQMWRKNLGIEISIYNQEWKVYMDAQHTHNFQIQRAGWIADYMDPHVYFDLWQTGGLNNDSGWGDPEYDRLLKSALSAPTTAARYEIYQRMEKIFLDGMPVIPIYFYTYVRLVSPRVTRFATTPLDNYPWKYADVDMTRGIRN
ncbi:MAG TPA: peptide ABC transporter substrate-binding protein [Opitutaceae bacterium]|nr:peptide ABC transporter substrate-binding protein [Opitutaceae bacterium]